VGLFDISVSVSCYNEARSIVPTIESISAALAGTGLAWEIIVVDDASADDSAEVVRGFIAAHPELPIRHLVHADNRGFIYGIFEALHAAQGQYFWVVAGDNNVSQAVATQLLSQVGKADIVIPRVLQYSGRGWQRRLISSTYASLVRLLSGCPVTYYNGSCIHRRSHLLWLEDKVSSFAYAADCITRLIDAGCSYVEVPVVYNERTDGKSSAISAHNFRDVGAFLAGLALRRVWKFVQPEKFALKKEELG
jgi:glycosyltransferase involved in cell wall biosynthesis